MYHWRSTHDPYGYVIAFLRDSFYPKAALFFLAILPQFVNESQGDATEQMLILGGIFTLIGMCLDLVVAFLASSAGDWLRRKTRFQRIQKWTAGGVYFSLGLSTALTGASHK
jgi:threonine/homoserine/homoserine lactone efflux protein